jgi:cation/acetate symporter
MIDHTASTKRRLVVARILLVLVALLGAWTAVTLPQSILIFVSWAFSVAASGLFAALVWACSGSAAPAPAPSPA